MGVVLSTPARKPRRFVADPSRPSGALASAGEPTRRPLPHRLEQQHRGGGRDVERADPPARRDRDEAGRSSRRRAGAAPPPRSRGPARPVPVRSASVYGVVGVRLGAVDPRPGVLGAERASRRGSAPGRRPGARRRLPTPCATAAVTVAERRSGITTPDAPGRLRGSADRAEVAWVLDLIEGHDQRIGRVQQRVRVRVGIGVDLGHDPLVVGRAGEPSQLRGGQLVASSRRGALGAAPRLASATGRCRRPPRVPSRHDRGVGSCRRAANQARAARRVSRTSYPRAASSSRSRSARSKSRSVLETSRSSSSRSASGSAASAGANGTRAPAAAASASGPQRAPASWPPIGLCDQLEQGRAAPSGC